MPINKNLRHYYKGPEWDATLEPLIKRSNNCCETCEAMNGRTVWVYKLPSGMKVWGYILKDTTWWKFGEKRKYFLSLSHSERVKARIEGRLKRVKIQCGRAHKDHDPSNHNLSNLLYLCRACHLIHDKDHHKETRSIRKDASRPLIAGLNG